MKIQNTIIIGYNTQGSFKNFQRINEDEREISTEIFAEVYISRAIL